MLRLLTRSLLQRHPIACHCCLIVTCSETMKHIVQGCLWAVKSSEHKSGWRGLGEFSPNWRQFYLEVQLVVGVSVGASLSADRMQR